MVEEEVVRAASGMDEEEEEGESRNTNSRAARSAYLALLLPTLVQTTQAALELAFRWGAAQTGVHT
jgi:hypothetical protein